MQGAPKSKEYLLLILIWKHAWMVHACLAEIVDLFFKARSICGNFASAFPYLCNP